MPLFSRRPSRSNRRGREPARWTLLEIMGIIVSVLLILFPLYAEIGYWVNPTIAPAQEITPPASTTAPEAPTEAAPAAEPTQAPAEEVAPTQAPAAEPTQAPAEEVAPTAEAEAPTQAPAAEPTQQTPPELPTEAPTEQAPAAPAATEEPAASPDDPDTQQRATITPQRETDTPGPSPTDDTGEATATPTDDTGEATATPTDDTGPQPSPTETIPPSDVLDVNKATNLPVSQIRPGQEFTYIVAVVTAGDTRIVALTDAIDSNLEVLSVNRSECEAGQTVSCFELTTAPGSPAVVNIRVRVRPGTPSGTVISNQAIVTDQIEGDVASNTVTLQVTGDQITPTPTTEPTDTATAGPSPTPTDTPPIVITITNTPRGTPPPTDTPGVEPPTSTPGGVPPTSTTIPQDGAVSPLPARPTVPPFTATSIPGVPGAPTSPGAPGGGGGGGGGGGDDDDDDDDNGGSDQAPDIPELPTLVPIAGVILPPLNTPVPQPTSAPPPPPAQEPVAPTAAPRAPTPVPPPAPVQPEQFATAEAEAADVAPPAETPEGPATAEPTEEAAADVDVSVRLGSDWGSAFPGQEVQYTFVIRNNRPVVDGDANTVRDLELSSRFPSNLEVNGARADRGSDPNITGNNLTYTLDELAPGEVVEVTVNTTIRSGIATGTILVAQGQLDFAGLDIPLNSNIVTVLIVDRDLRVTVTATSTPSVSPTVDTGAVGQSVAGSPTTTGTAATQVAGLAATPRALPQQTEEAAAGEVPPPADGTAPLPPTSTGVPLLGILMLGITMLIRTVRLHRARERI